MQVSRNDPCPCGSGKKYKICCQESVNVYTTGLLSVAGADSAGQMETVRSLGFWCGLQMPGAGTPPAPDLLGRLLSGAWHAGRPSSTMSGRIGDLLLNKGQLLRLRIPVDLLTGADLQEGEPSGSESLAERIVGSLPPAFYDFALYQIALSLRNDSLTDEELQTLLLAFSWARGQETRPILAACVLDATMTELATAQQELVELDLGSPDNADPTSGNEKMRQFFASHPTYDGFISARMIAEIEPAFRAIIKPGALEMPLYSIIGGCYALCLEALEALSGSSGHRPEAGMSGGRGHRSIQESLWSQEESIFFIPLLQAAVAGWSHVDQEESLIVSMRQLKDLLGGYFMTCQFVVAENFYLHCILNLVQEMPRSLPGVEAPLSGFMDLCRPEVMEPYIHYLELQHQVEEADHVRQQFQVWAGRIAAKYASVADIAATDQPSPVLFENILK